MKNLTLENITNAVHGTYFGPAAMLHREVMSITTDSRNVETDGLFIAIVGERSDGHAYISSTYDKGALCCISERILPDHTQPYIVVESSLQALKDLATYYRSVLDIKVVGITGSVGKTSTKEMIASVLSQKYQVLKTLGNFNNEIGLPLTIFRLREGDEIAVLEMGISEFGEMSRLTAVAKPDVVVITNIGQCHLENLKDRDGVLKAKSEIFEGLQKDGAIILNGDDDKLAAVGKTNGIIPKFFTLNPKLFNTIPAYAGYADAIDSLGLLGTMLDLHLKNGESVDSISKACIHIPGHHMIYNAMAGALVGQHFGLTPEEIKTGIDALVPVSGRNHIFRSQNMTIIDDCYNANPVSMKASIDVVCTAPTRKVCILGDMFELGQDERKLHYEIGRYLVEKNVDVLYAIGNLAKEYVAGAESLAADTLTIRAFDTLDAFMAEATAGILFQPEDTILIKASHGMQFTKIVDYFSESN